MRMLIDNRDLELLLEKKKKFIGKKFLQSLYPQ